MSAAVDLEVALAIAPLLQLRAAVADADGALFAELLRSPSTVASSGGVAIEDGAATRGWAPTRSRAPHAAERANVRKMGVGRRCGAVPCGRSRRICVARRWVGGLRGVRTRAEIGRKAQIAKPVSFEARE